MPRTTAVEQQALDQKPYFNLNLADASSLHSPRFAVVPLNTWISRQGDLQKVQ